MLLFNYYVSREKFLKKNLFSRETFFNFATFNNKKALWKMKL